MTDSHEVLLEMRSIGKNFPGVKALSNVDFSIRKGEIIALCGENGAGKSTMMKILSGIYKPDAGEIVFQGEAVHITKPDVAQKLGIAIIHQELSLVPELTVAENIFIGDYPQKFLGVVDWRKMRKNAQAVLEDMGFKMDVDQRVGDLGIAKQQIVEIAKALHKKAKVVILDEPTAPLANQDVDRLIDLVLKLRSEGLGIVYISHRLPEVFQISDRVTVLKDGQLVSTCDTKDLDRDRLIKLMVGREVSNMRLGSVDNHETKVLSVRGLSTSSLLEDINFDLYKGEVLGIAGLVGSGRTELVRAIFGADPCTAEMELNGKPLSVKTPRDAINQGIALLPEDRKEQALVLGMSALENITISGLNNFSKFGIFNKRKEEEDGRELVKKLQVRVSGLSQETRTLSGGNQQKLIIARWLYNRAKVLIFDEPTRGIDVGAKAEIYNLINQFVKEGGSVIVISSELPEVLMCDRLLVMARGKIVNEIPHEEFSEEKVIQYMF
ncbi:sugar ABC transporter ATP-binding protein [Peribacillus cavernae]|uniref:Sugar ABC transporter ATP-binding protein n=1 Tax=Peribacillus cavernae TaxID=1674310 RepID=A0A433HVV5_9BACI|nr:sugar ABC transporter ATP-binding protein [Peribacillus cavernae]MDQ0220697.1 ribose transport system ATP-binding protein [Peribacillus cavernae]RUQ32416.1 sugar ABC transporter ATP-binding protein [Peribacillus cavernae]